jgi:hypothetical protein
MIDIVVTFVHGTFAQGAEWISNEAAFPSILREIAQGAVATFPFNWSGKNTQSARNQAAQELAEHLAKSAKSYPTARQVIIAPSHGGNVAIRAIQLLSMPHIELVTLGTPFINIERRDLSPLFELAYSTGAAVIWFSFVSLCVFFIAQLIAIVDSSNPVLIALFGSIFAAIWIGKFVGAVAMGKLIQPLLGYALKRQESIVRKTLAICRSTNDVLVVAVQGDEAMRGLSALDAIAQAPRFLADLLGQLAEEAALIAELLTKSNNIVTRIASIFFSVIKIIVAALFAFAFFLTTLLPIVFLLLTLPLLMLSFISRAAYWDYTVLDAMVARVWVGRSPKLGWQPPADLSSWNIQKYPLWRVIYRSDRTLRSLLLQHVLQHSTLYQREDIIQEICDWIVNHSRPPCALPVEPSADEYNSYEFLADLFRDLYREGDARDNITPVETSGSLQQLILSTPTVVHVYEYGSVASKLQVIALRALCNEEAYRSIRLVRFFCGFGNEDIIKKLRCRETTIIGFKGGMEVCRVSDQVTDKSIRNVFEALL